MELFDIPILVNMVKDCHSETYYSKYKFSYQAVTATFSLCLNEEQVSCFVTCDEENGIRGFIVIAVDNPFFSRERFAHNLLVYVKPEFRSGKDFLFLLRKLIEVAKEKNCIDIECSNSSKIKSERFDDMLENIGFKSYGKNLRMEA